MRTWHIWSLDVTKQICSLALGHVMNLVLSEALSAGYPGDPCIWYLSIYSNLKIFKGISPIS